MPPFVHTEVQHAAAWTTEGTMEAQLQLPGSRAAVKRGMLYNMTGSALRVGGVALNRAKTGRQRPSAPPPGAEAVVSVRTRDLGAFLRQRFCAADFVRIKCDIEGAEFDLFEHLLRTGAAGIIDEASVEWHLSKRPMAEKQALRVRQNSISKRLMACGVRLTTWKL